MLYIHQYSTIIGLHIINVSLLLYLQIMLQVTSAVSEMAEHWKTSLATGHV
jgi:hypothetical protein